MLFRSVVFSSSDKLFVFSKKHSHLIVLYLNICRKLYDKVDTNAKGRRYYEKWNQFEIRDDKLFYKKFDLESSKDGNGTHWMALKIENKDCVYFDSYGMLPPEEIITFCKRISKSHLSYNTKEILLQKVIISSGGSIP